MRLNYGGVIGGVIGYFTALTPSLMPRPMLFMGLIAGIGFAIGYGFGLLGSWLLRWLHVPEPAVHVKRSVWRITLIVLAVLVVLLGYLAAGWQNGVRAAIGQPLLHGSDIFGVIIISALTAAILLQVARSARRASRAMKRQISKIQLIPRRFITIISVGLFVTVLVLLINGVLFRGLKLVANHIYSSNNAATATGAIEPTSPLRSGGPNSLVSWQSLGRQGRNFVGRGPSAAQLTGYSGQPALEPIRVYAGLDSASTIAERADLAVKELERTGAFNRKVLVVATATGSGWIDPQASNTLEYMYNGDTAMATIQYSYLPSWMALLANRDDATTAGQALFEAVYTKWITLPADQRPQLYSYGLSLGSFGGQAAFSGANDLAARTNGALFLGTPSFSQPWAQFTTRRQAGSPEILPIYQNGRIVRFAGSSQDISQAQANWPGSRTLYVQYPSDPVVWWSPSLLFQKPDWLQEPRGHDVSPAVHWYPIITFIQLTVDQFFANDVPGPHGHDYGPTMVNSWVAVTRPANWSTTQTNRLQNLINHEADAEE